MHFAGGGGELGGGKLRFVSWMSTAGELEQERREKGLTAVTRARGWYIAFLDRPSKFIDLIRIQESIFYVNKSYIYLTASTVFPRGCRSFGS